VADIGAGSVALRLSGSRVYAVEINDYLKYISARAEQQKCPLFFGKEDDPFLPQQSDAVLILNLSRNCPASPPVKAPSAVDALGCAQHH